MSASKAERAELTALTETVDKLRLALDAALSRIEALEEAQTAPVGGLTNGRSSRANASRVEPT